MSTGKVEQPKKARSPLKAVVAGGIAGGVEIFVTYPTEFVKTQLQLDERNKVRKFNGPVSVIKSTLNARGFFGLYRGMSSQLYGSIPKSAIRFGSFDTYKKILVDAEGKLSVQKTFLCGLMAGMTEAVLIVCPMETVKVKFIHDQNREVPKYRGFFHGVKEMVKAEGFRGVYKGVFPTMAKQGSNQAIRFVTFNQIKSFFQGGDPSKQLSVLQAATAGALAGACSVFGNTPIDVVKTRLQVSLDMHLLYGTHACMACETNLNCI
eukprot:Nk52_evm23s230 gene=Nk52_evmTU23s230